MLLLSYGVMYGESMDQVPHDLIDRWVVMPYPVGVRCIITTGKGKLRASYGFHLLMLHILQEKQSHEEKMVGKRSKLA